MNLENQLLEKFQVEELGKRYEFAWIEEVKVGASVKVTDTATITASVTIPIK